MSTRTDSGENDPIIESREQLIAAFAKGAKPKDRWRIGTEHEKFVYARRDYHAPSYDERGGIHTLLIGLTRYGWNPVFEGRISSPFPAPTAPSAWNRPASSNCRARRWKISTRPARKPAGIWNR